MGFYTRIIRPYPHYMWVSAFMYLQYKRWLRWKLWDLQRPGYRTNPELNEDLDSTAFLLETFWFLTTIGAICIQGFICICYTALIEAWRRAMSGCIFKVFHGHVVSITTFEFSIDAFPVIFLFFFWSRFISVPKIISNSIGVMEAFLPLHTAFLYWHMSLFLFINILKIYSNSKTSKSAKKKRKEKKPIMKTN